MTLQIISNFQPALNYFLFFIVFLFLQFTDRDTFREKKKKRNHIRTSWRIAHVQNYPTRNICKGVGDKYIYERGKINFYSRGEPSSWERSLTLCHYRRVVITCVCVCVNVSLSTRMRIESMGHIHMYISVYVYVWNPYVDHGRALVRRVEGEWLFRFFFRKGRQLA